MSIFYINQMDGSVASTITIGEDQAGLYADPQLYVALPPPTCQPGYAPTWDGSAWSCALDLRGSVWHAPGTSTYIVITSLGQQPPEGWLAGPPPPEESNEGTVDL